MSGGLDQLETDWSASYASAVPFVTRSYLDWVGAAYFLYKNMQTEPGASYKYP